MKTLSDVCKFLSGGTPHKGTPEYWGGDISWISAATMTRRFLVESPERISAEGLANGSRLAPAGSTLLLVRGSGLFNYIPICFALEPIAFNQDVKALVPKEGIDPLFFHYWVESLRPILQENIEVTGIGAGKFEMDFLSRLPFPEMSLPNQREIGRQIALFDQKIDSNSRLSSLLEQAAQTLFKSWFVDFDPVVAKSEGRKPFGMSDEIAALFPDSFEESELGAVPKGWRVVDIGHLTDIQNGFAFKSDWWKPQGTPVVKIGSVKPGYVDVADASFLDSKKAAEFRAYELEEGDILIGLTGYPGEVGLVPRSIPKPLLNQRVGRFTPKKAIYRSFVYAMTRRSEFREQVEQRAHGTAQLNVSTSGILSIKCTVPSEELLEVFHRLMDPMIAKILNCFDETLQLSKARDALLPELLEGRVFETSRVKEATAA